MRKCICSSMLQQLQIPCISFLWCFWQPTNSVTLSPSPICLVELHRSLPRGIINRTSNYICDIHPFIWRSYTHLPIVFSWTNCLLDTHMFIRYILVHHLVTLSHLFIHVFCKLDVRTYNFHLMWGEPEQAPIKQLAGWLFY